MYAQATDVFDIIAEQEIEIFVNVISRLEFVDLIFRKQITLGAIKLFDLTNPKTPNQNLYRHLKYIRDKNKENEKKGMSFKIGEFDLKKLRKEIVASSGIIGWKQFCDTYTNPHLVCCTS